MASKRAIIAAIQSTIDEWGDCPPSFVEVPADFLKDVLKYLEGKKNGGVRGDAPAVPGVKQA